MAGVEDRAAVEARILSSAPAFVTRRRRGGVTFGREWQEIDLGEGDGEAMLAILADRLIETRETSGESASEGIPQEPSGADPPKDRAGGEISKDREADPSGDVKLPPEGAQARSGGKDPPPPKAKAKAKRVRRKRKKK